MSEAVTTQVSGTDELYRKLVDEAMAGRRKSEQVVLYAANMMCNQVIQAGNVTANPQAFLFAMYGLDAFSLENEDVELINGLAERFGKAKRGFPIAHTRYESLDDRLKVGNGHTVMPAVTGIVTGDGLRYEIHEAFASHFEGSVLLPISNAIRWNVQPEPDRVSEAEFRLAFLRRSDFDLRPTLYDYSLAHHIGMEDIMRAHKFSDGVGDEYDNEFMARVAMIGISS
ncbi:MAG: hypothetical protein ACXWLH_04170 [Candidatus Saccharimonadales bacterium]